MENQQYVATPAQQNNNPGKLRSIASGATGFASGIVGYNAGEHYINKGLDRLGKNHKFTKFMNSGHRWLTPNNMAASLIGMGTASVATGALNHIYNMRKNKATAQKQYQR